MRNATAITLVTASLLAAPAAAGAQQGVDDARVSREAAALPERLWAPGAEPVSAAGPQLPDDDASAVAPLLAVLLVLGAAGAGFCITLLRPAGVRRAAVPAPAPAPVAAPAPALAPAPVPAPAPAPEYKPVAPAPRPVVPDKEEETGGVCVIALSHAWGRGRFEVRVKDRGGAHRVVASSLAFEVPPGMVVLETGTPGRAHRRLLLHLLAAGWRLDPFVNGRWYERRLSRPPSEPDDRGIDRALVATRPDGSEAEFVALALDGYGNAHVMARSPRFGRRAGRPIEATDAARAAHGTLLGDLEAHGWHVSGTLESWYGAALSRRRR